MRSLRNGIDQSHLAGFDQREFAFDFSATVKLCPWIGSQLNQGLFNGLVEYLFMEWPPIN